MFFPKSRLCVDGEVDGVPFTSTVARPRGTEYASTETRVETTLPGTPPDFHLELRRREDTSAAATAATGDASFDSRWCVGADPPGEAQRWVSPPVRQKMMQLAPLRGHLRLRCARGRYNLRHYRGDLPPGAPADVHIAWEGYETEHSMLDAAVAAVATLCRGT